MFPFSQLSGNSPHCTQFLKVLKRFNYSVAEHFQHATTDHIMTMNMISSEHGKKKRTTKNSLFGHFSHRVLGRY